MWSSHRAPKFKVGDRVKAKFPSKIGQEKYFLLILFWKLILGHIELKTQVEKK